MIGCVLRRHAVNQSRRSFVFGPKAGNPIGLDIGSDTIKLVELTSSGSGLSIKSFAHRMIPYEAQDDPNAVATLVRSMFEEQNIKGRGVFISVSGQSVVIRRTTLPKMPAGEIPEAIKWDAREEILFPLEGAAVDYHITGETQQATGTFYELLTVIAQDSVIREVINLTKKSELKILGITAFPIALWDYDRTLHPMKEGEIACFIDMGATRTRVYFATNRDLLFSREIPNAGDEVTEALLGEFKTSIGAKVVLSDERAEEIKKEYGLPAENAEGETPEGIPLSALREALLPALESQLIEIERSIEYFKNLFKMDNVVRVTLSGGAGGLAGFFDYINERLEFKIERANPLFQSTPAVKGVTEKEMKLIGPSLAGAAGLAIGRCDKINLLPEEFRFSFKKSILALARAAIIPAIALILIAYGIHLRGKVDEQQKLAVTKQKELEQVQQAIALMEEPKKTLVEVESQRNKLRQQLSLMPSGVETETNLNGLLHELARILPEEAALSQVTFSAKGDPSLGGNDEDQFVLIQGNIFGDEVEVLMAMEYFLEDLNASSFFNDAKLMNSAALNGGKFTVPGISFSISAYLQDKDSIEVPL